MFKNILGNVEIKNTLNQSIINKKETHSYMFIGTDGIGKKLIAREFAKAILCLDEERYCNKCKSCIEFDGSNNPDFSEITSEGNHIGIEKIREMQKRVYEKQKLHLGVFKKVQLANILKSL